jgi:hypothetical protein
MTMLSMTGRAIRASLLCVIGAACVLVAPSAHANPKFPELLQQNVPMPCAPACTICHQTNEGGYGTVKPKTIGASWVMYGLDGGSPSSLVPALMAAKSEMNDADGDGIPDVTELAMGENPSDPTNAAPLCGADAPKSVQYGCASRIAPQGHVDNVAAAASALVALLGVSALRRRRSPPKK